MATMLWLHTGGILAALSPTTMLLVVEAATAAQRHGTIVSYDLNYRPSLWKSAGGLERAQQVTTAIARFVDVMLGNGEDFSTCLGLPILVQGPKHDAPACEDNNH